MVFRWCCHPLRNILPLGIRIVIHEPLSHLMIVLFLEAVQYRPRFSFGFHLRCRRGALSSSVSYFFGSKTKSLGGDVNSNFIASDDPGDKSCVVVAISRSSGHASRRRCFWWPRVKSRGRSFAANWCMFTYFPVRISWQTASSHVRELKNCSATFIMDEVTNPPSPTPFYILWRFAGDR